MANGVNKWIGIGNVGKDPELRYTAGGTAVCNFSLAINSTRGKGADKQEHTEWVRVVAMGKSAEFVGEYVKKGSLLYVEGKFQTRSWEDKNTGEKKYASEIFAQFVNALGGGAGAGGKSGYAKGSRGGGRGYEGWPDDDGVGSYDPSDESMPF